MHNRTLALALTAAVLLAALALAAALQPRADGSAAVPAPVATPDPTGIAELDAVIAHIVAEDVDALLALVEFAPEPCVTSGPDGVSLFCEPGVAAGTPIDAFAIGSCELAFLTDSEQIRDFYAREFEAAGPSSVYAVVRGGPRFREPRDGYVVVSTPGAVATPMAFGTFWYVTPAGRIAGNEMRCGNFLGAAQMLAEFFPQPEFVLGPFNNCSPGPGEPVNLVVTVEETNPQDPGGQFVGPVLAPRTSERAFVYVSGSTRFEGAVSGFDAIAEGARIRVTGTRQADCTILADSIAPPESAAPAPAGSSDDSDRRWLWWLAAAAIAAAATLALALAMVRRHSSSRTVD